MTTPSLALQKAMRTALRDNAVMTSLVNKRVYDRIPSDAVFPYVRFGSFQRLKDTLGDCRRAWEIFARIDVLSRGVGKPEMESIAGAIEDVLDEAELVLDGHVLVTLDHEQTLDVGDPDPTTQHGVVIFRALVEAA